MRHTRRWESSRAPGGNALVEFRRIVGVLVATPMSLRPSDARGRAAQRIGSSPTAAGLPVSLSITGSPEALSASLDLVAYRLVQET